MKYVKFKFFIYSLLIFILSSTNIYSKNIDILRLEQVCGKSKKGKPGWDDKFFGTVTDNTFQAIRYWKAKPGDKRYKVGDVGYEIYNGFKKGNKLVINVNGRYSMHADKWKYKFSVNSEQSIKQILYKGVKAKRGEKDWARDCNLKSYDAVNMNMAMSYLQVTKTLNEKIKKLENDLQQKNSGKIKNSSNDELLKKLNLAINENKKLKSDIERIKIKEKTKSLEKKENSTELAQKDTKVTEKINKSEQKEKTKKKQVITYQSDYEQAQSFIEDLKEFIKSNPNEFDIIKTTELFIENQDLLDGKWDDQTKKKYKKLVKFTDSSKEFSSYHNNKNNERLKIYTSKLKTEKNKLENNIASLKNYLVENLGSKQSKKVLNEIKNSEKILNGNNLSNISEKNSNLSEFINNLKNPNKNESKLSKDDTLKKNIEKKNDVSEKINLSNTIDPKKEINKLKIVKDDAVKNLKGKLKEADKLKDQIDSSKLKGELNKLTNILKLKPKKNEEKNKISEKSNQKVDLDSKLSGGCSKEYKYSLYKNVDKYVYAVGPEKYFNNRNEFFKRFSILIKSLKNPDQIVEYKFNLDGTLVATNLTDCKPTKLLWDGDGPYDNTYYHSFGPTDNKKYLLTFSLNDNPYGRNYEMQFFERGVSNCYNDMNPACHQWMGETEIVGFRDLKNNLSFSELKNNYLAKKEAEKQKKIEKEKKLAEEKNKAEQEERKRLAELPMKNWETKSQIFGIKLLSSPTDYKIKKTWESSKDFLFLDLENDEKYYKDKYENLDIKNNIYLIESPVYKDDDLKFYIRTSKFEKKEIITSISIIMKEKFDMGYISIMTNEKISSLETALANKYGFYEQGHMNNATGKYHYDTGGPWKAKYKDINLNINITSTGLKGNKVTRADRKMDTWLLRLLIHEYSHDTLFNLLEIPKERIKLKGPKFKSNNI